MASRTRIEKLKKHPQSECFFSLKSGNYRILRDESEVLNTVDTHCFAARDERCTLYVQRGDRTRRCPFGFSAVNRKKYVYYRLTCHSEA